MTLVRVSFSDALACVGWGLCAASVAVSCYALVPHFRAHSFVVATNDNILARTSIKHAASLLRSGAGTPAATPTSPGAWLPDHWLPQIGAGFPLWAHYQHLPYLACALLKAAAEAAGLARDLPIVDVWSAAVLCATPLSLFVSLRKMGLSALAGGVVAALYLFVNDAPPDEEVRHGSRRVGCVWRAGREERREERRTLWCARLCGVGTFTHAHTKHTLTHARTHAPTARTPTSPRYPHSNYFTHTTPQHDTLPHDAHNNVHLPEPRADVSPAELRHRMEQLPG
jgi:hypothetical protein